jgi:hypothetical protein
MGLPTITPSGFDDGVDKSEVCERPSPEAQAYIPALEIQVMALETAVLLLETFVRQLEATRRGLTRAAAAGLAHLVAPVLERPTSHSAPAAAVGTRGGSKADNPGTRGTLEGWCPSKRRRPSSPSSRRGARFASIRCKRKTPYPSGIRSPSSRP